MDNSPVEMYRDNLPPALTAMDPVTGRMIVVVPNNIAIASSATAYKGYQLDPYAPSGSQWTERTDVESFMAANNINLAPAIGLGNFSTEGVITLDVPEYGVTLIWNRHVYVYKNSSPFWASDGNPSWIS